MMREPLHKPFTFCDNYRTAGVSSLFHLEVALLATLTVTRGTDIHSVSMAIDSTPLNSPQSSDAPLSSHI
jgi:hypothetical protein